MEEEFQDQDSENYVEVPLDWMSDNEFNATLTTSAKLPLVKGAVSHRELAGNQKAPVRVVRIGPYITVGKNLL